MSIQISISSKQQLDEKYLGWLLVTKRFCRRRDLLSALNFIKPSSGTCAAPSVLSKVGGDNPDNPPTDQEETSSP
jgi:hypothetical protein